eukprot:660389-Prymnesium_polylepis.2
MVLPRVRQIQANRTEEKRPEWEVEVQRELPAPLAGCAELPRHDNLHRIPQPTDCRTLVRTVPRLWLARGHRLNDTVGDPSVVRHRQIEIVVASGRYLIKGTARRQVEGGLDIVDGEGPPGCGAALEEDSQPALAERVPAQLDRLERGVGAQTGGDHDGALGPDSIVVELDVQERAVAPQHLAHRARGALLEPTPAEVERGHHRVVRERLDEDGALCRDLAPPE